MAPLCHNQPHDHQKFTTTMNNFTSELQEEEEEKEKTQKHSNHIGVISSLNTTCCKTRNSWIDDTYRSHSPPPLKFHPLNLSRKKIILISMERPSPIISYYYQDLFKKEARGPKGSEVGEHETISGYINISRLAQWSPMTRRVYFFSMQTLQFNSRSYQKEYNK